jgi:beta-1,2-mannobiose phosphorylase / 1,2-beta-oligomannan phosphorylase
MTETLKTNHKTPVGVLRYKNKVAIFYHEKIGAKHSLTVATSQDGVSFKMSRERVTVHTHSHEENIDHCEDFKFSVQDKHSVLVSYIRKTGSKKTIVFAVSHDLKNFHTVRTSTVLHGSGFVVPDYVFEGGQVLYLGERGITTAISKHSGPWKPTGALVLERRGGFFDHDHLSPLGVHYSKKDIALFYDATIRENGIKKIQVGAALISAKNPHKTIWRSEVPILDHLCEEDPSFRVFGVLVHGDKILIYATDKAGDLFLVRIPNIFRIHPDPKKRPSPIKRHHKNPILSPRELHWETEGTFNPAALYLNGRVHLLYRALGRDGMSVLGYASSEDGIHFDDRPEEPAYIPKEEFEGAGGSFAGKFSMNNASGGGWGGCEDPKLTVLEDTVYLTYVAHNGRNMPRGAMSSISIDDFLNKRWDKWTKSKLITVPGHINKSVCLLPEKIDGKYVLFHRIFPNILIDVVDDLDLGEDTGKWLVGHKHIPIRPFHWDSRKLSVGGTPIKIDLGWLVIYHAVDDRDPGNYKLGAMILDKDDPSKVLYRCNAPLLSPEMHYENDWKPGIIYPCGAVLIGDTVFTYYGGGDKYVCVATTPLQELLDHLKEEPVSNQTPQEIVIS